ncbi:unnamed protein product [Ectocarpus sp. CCAP 1310/34]|nr:unnamed protein product [Ectocarpus sp. CCAP 1310/34]
MITFNVCSGLALPLVNFEAALGTKAGGALSKLVEESLSSGVEAMASIAGENLDSERPADLLRSTRLMLRHQKTSRRTARACSLLRTGTGTTTASVEVGPATAVLPYPTQVLESSRTPCATDCDWHQSGLTPSRPSFHRRSRSWSPMIDLDLAKVC